MPILILLIVLLIFLALLYPRFFAPGRARRCRWNPARAAAGAQLSRWQCDECGVEAFSSDGRPPKECKRTLKSGL